MHRTRDVLIGTLRLGVSLSAQHLVPFASYLGEFTRDHPGVDLRLRYGPGLAMISMVGAGELDCVIGPAVSQVPGVRMTRLAGEPLHLVCRADHRLAGRAAVSVRELTGERFVEVPEGWTARLLSDAAFAGEGDTAPRRLRGRRLGAVPRAGQRGRRHRLRPGRPAVPGADRAGQRPAADPGGGSAPGKAHLPDAARGGRDQPGGTAVRRPAAAHPPRGQLTRASRRQVM